MDPIKVPSELVQSFSKTRSCTDIVCANKIGFMTSIGYPSFFRKTAHAENGKPDMLHECLDKVLRAHNDGEFCMDAIDCDNGF